MADSYRIIDGKVVPYSGGRKCNDTDAWRDATPLELQLQEQLSEYEYTTAAQEDEIKALRAEVERLRDDGASAVRWAPGSAYWSEVLVELFGPDARKGIDVLEARWRKEIERAERLVEALKEIRSRSSIDLAMRSDQFELTARLGDIHQIAGAALAQENKA